MRRGYLNPPDMAQGAQSEVESRIAGEFRAQNTRSETESRVAGGLRCRAWDDKFPPLKGVREMYGAEITRNCLNKNRQ